MNQRARTRDGRDTFGAPSRTETQKTLTDECSQKNDAERARLKRRIDDLLQERTTLVAISECEQQKAELAKKIDELADNLRICEEADDLQDLVTEQEKLLKELDVRDARIVNLQQQLTNERENTQRREYSERQASFDRTYWSLYRRAYAIREDCAREKE